jgi:hypothetical protein
MAGPVICLRAIHFDTSDQAKMLKMLESKVIIHEKRDNYYDFTFKKGKTLGLNLKENSCTFLMDIRDTDNETDDIQQADMTAKLRDNPVAFISISAMCNQTNDHYLLAAFILELHKILRGGYIELNGVIKPPILRDKWGKILKDENGEFMYPNIPHYLSTIKGDIHDIRYRLDDYGSTYYAYVCNAEWLHNWLQHPDFHLIK